MGVHIDPARRDEETVGIDVALGGALFAADRCDTAAAMATSPVKARLAGAIDDGAAANDDIVHGSRPLVATAP